MGFQLVPRFVTLSDLKDQKAVTTCYFTQNSSFGSQLHQVHCSQTRIVSDKKWPRESSFGNTWLMGDDTCYICGS